MPKYNIVIIGAGNVATQLGIAFKHAKHNILQVYSQSTASASTLAKILNCKYTTTIDALNLTADIYIIAIKDDAIAQLAKQLRLKDKIVAHTSGSISIDALKNISKNYGVFYPLQTFSKNKKVSFKELPLCLEANSSNTYKTLHLLAKSIGKNIQKVNSEQRINIHLAAVFACNFSNHMYTIANEILKHNKLSLDLIKPLISETAEKVQYNSPSKMQTGPAIRGDKKIMAKHLAMMTDKTQKRLYKLISSSISERSK